MIKYHCNIYFSKNVLMLKFLENNRDFQNFVSSKHFLDSFKIKLKLYKIYYSLFT